MASGAQGLVPSGSVFAAVDNQIHFHPDERLGGFAILVLLRRSALRPAGVHLLDADSHRWWKAADLDDLPSDRWMHLRSEAGALVPVEVLRTGGGMRVRWLGSDDEPVEPAPWDRARRGQSSDVASTREATIDAEMIPSITRRVCCGSVRQARRVPTMSPASASPPASIQPRAGPPRRSASTGPSPSATSRAPRDRANSWTDERRDSASPNQGSDGSRGATSAVTPRPMRP